MNQSGPYLEHITELPENMVRTGDTIRNDLYHQTNPVPASRLEYLWSLTKNSPVAYFLSLHVLLLHFKYVHTMDSRIRNRTEKPSKHQAQTGPDLTARRNIIKIPSFTTVTHMLRASVCLMPAP